MHSMARRVLAALGGTDFDLVQLRVWAQAADRLVAADSGADRLICAGFAPDVVLGDLDSVQTLEALERATILPDQDPNTTDCQKLLAYLRGEGVEAVTIACVEGDRLDHVLGTLSACLVESPRIQLLLRRGLAWPLLPGIVLSVSARPGARVALLPMEACSAVTLRGVRWALEDAEMSPRGLVSVSNEATSERVEASLEAGSAWLIAEREPTEEPTW